MTGLLTLENLLAYCLQVTALVGAGALLAWAFRLREPRAAVVFWRGLLAACVLLPAVQPWTHEVLLRVAPRAVTTSAAAAAPARSAGAPLDVAQILWAVLATGLALRLAWTTLGLLRLQRYRRRARTLADPLPFVSEFVCALAPNAHIRVSGEVRGPVTFGLLRPIVLLPESFASRPERVQRAMICHELLHVARQDAAYTLAEEVIAALLWFHPAVWWLVRRIRLACEQAVDSQAVEVIADRRQYLDAVLETAGVQVPAPGTGFSSPFLNRSQLVERVALIAKEIPMSRIRVAASTLSSAVLVIAAAVLAVRAFPLKGEPQAAAQTPSDRVRIGPDVLAKMVISSPSCASPESTGVNVMLEAVIGKDGTVAEVSTIPNAPPAAVAAVDCVKAWRFEPLMIGGKAIEAIAMIRVPLTSADGKPPQRNITMLMNPRTIFSSGGPGGGVVGGVPGGVGKGAGMGVGSGVGGGVVGGVPSTPRTEVFPPAEPGKMRIKVGANVQQAKLEDAPEPLYPPLAMQARIQGTVVFQVLVSETGEVKNVALVSGHPLLVPAAMEAVRKYKYKTTLLNGQPIEVVSTVEVPFRLTQ